MSQLIYFCMYSRATSFDQNTSLVVWSSTDH